MSKARLWLKEDSAYPTRAVSDARLNEIVGVLDKCSSDADNGTWGCVDCQEFAKCWRLYNSMVGRSVERVLMVRDLEYFNAKFAVIKNGGKK